MINNLRFELSFKNIDHLDKKLLFCKENKIYNINIPCKGLIKKEFLNSIMEHINKYHKEFDVVYHYSLFHQYKRNKENSYQDLLDFLEKSNSNKNKEILLVSGSNKKKDFDVTNVLDQLKNEKNINAKLGIAHNPYLSKYFKVFSERERYKKKISSGLINSVWFQFGTDINSLENEIDYLKSINKFKKINLFGSLLIPSKQFIARFKFRPWKGVHISDNYLRNLDNFNEFTKSLINFYLNNNITPVIETDFSTLEKLDVIYSILKL